MPINSRMDKQIMVHPYNGRCSAMRKSLWVGHWLGEAWRKLPQGWKCCRFLFRWWLYGDITIWKHYWIVHLRFVYFMYITLKTILLMRTLGWYLLLKSLEEGWKIEQCQRAGPAGEEVRMQPVRGLSLSCMALLPAPGAGSSYCSCVFLVILTHLSRVSCSMWATAIICPGQNSPKDAERISAWRGEGDGLP